MPSDTMHEEIKLCFPVRVLATTTKWYHLHISTMPHATSIMLWLNFWCHPSGISCRKCQKSDSFIRFLKTYPSLVFLKLSRFACACYGKSWSPAVLKLMKAAMSCRADLQKHWELKMISAFLHILCMLMIHSCCAMFSKVDFAWYLTRFSHRLLSTT